MITIKCNQSIFRNISRCIKYGACPKENDTIDDFCEDECIYNFSNIDFIAIDGEGIIISGVDISDLKVCMKESIYNYPKCCEPNDCEDCPYYYRNIAIEKKRG